MHDEIATSEGLAGSGDARLALTTRVSPREAAGRVDRALDLAYAHARAERCEGQIASVGEKNGACARSHGGVQACTLAR
jgi:hypothetical protein